MTLSPKPLIGFAAFSGTGKTTLLCQIIPLLTARGLRLGLIKHSHHAFELDRPGKDSFVLRQAGAQQVVVASRRRSAVLRQYPASARLSLAEFLGQFDTDELDLILVEGYKYYPLPKIELYRPSLGHPLLAPDDPDIIAVATDAPLAQSVAVPLLNLNQPCEIADFIMTHCWSSPNKQNNPVTVD
ncbi:MAG: molybdopterin-guanine dinucleotide biosynthesis protein B [Candidatus Competibacteraceae bacterium]|nr:molybdopterin-guanine dinucleotide biosynthesis protein B [Candidatus Competibacteraceae bacterium]MCB1804821.1 molybdopterin-guanine dinucleotide biosynthesis protein B [Candidatus Competibacteraceae bacterium]MCB1810911.1 molybdopterin-guanine dinucleotide biosynthesis protein B [Candidatus Competibacteraceae bacterium]